MHTREDTVMRWQYQRIHWQRIKFVHAIEKLLERICFRLVAPHADVGGDARQYLIARNQNVVARRKQRGVFRCVPERGDHTPGAFANNDFIIFHDAVILLRYGGHTSLVCASTGFLRLSKIRAHFCQAVRHE